MAPIGTVQSLVPGSGGLVPGCLDAGRIGRIGRGDGGDRGDWNGRRGLEEIPTRSSFRSSADLQADSELQYSRALALPPAPCQQVASDRLAAEMGHSFT